MSSYDLTERAEADLFDLTLYGMKLFGARQAEAYAADLERIFQLIADTPRMGRKADGIRPGVRRHEHGSHIILYQEAPSGITVLAIVHKSSVKRLAL
ncbi:type II toxin-antitoxin system RelE/ParE family toxin [Bosea sp. (in: a-proteobacteria)]|uniref:type II toxin-antitoxin system RelE/ParE family toxin n=1 Tax=Bosea sp. (in: a-proteobacteria) TaxID=1871050 RepID=UPI002735C35C|nr:type II toxin-antitoxin system RelE/ParE family toxin [Bosea sp. (in: a-proteobacteria)]MDP3408556.1 type II toxin-antitoxin system RelE/ParE family toxin [Bosea sp. (in: a-proteobacteria)]